MQFSTFVAALALAAGLATSAPIDVSKLDAAVVKRAENQVWLDYFDMQKREAADW